MKVETKFNVGDKAVTLQTSPKVAIVEFTVAHIQILQGGYVGDGMVVQYCPEKEDGSTDYSMVYDESVCFRTRDEVLEQLMRPF